MTASDEKNVGPTTYLNELKITRCLAQREYLKGNFEKASEYYEKILTDPESVGDVETRIIWSKCQRNLFQPDAAFENQLLAESIDPTPLSVIENKASLLNDLTEYEASLWNYFRGIERETFPKMFTTGILTVEKILDDTVMPRERSIYTNDCLGNTFMRLAGQRKFMLKVTRGDPDYAKNAHYDRKKELFYLRHLAVDKKFCDQMLKRDRPRPPFCDTRKAALSGARNMVEAGNQVVETLYKKKPLYVHWCEVNKKSGARLQNERERAKSKIQHGRQQITRYMNDICEMIRNDEIAEAKDKTELLILYKDKISYTRNETFHWIFHSFGVVQYLKFQNIDGWTEEKNYHRKLVLLGLVEDNIRFRESLFGRIFANPRLNKFKLWSRIQKSKCSVEKMYLHFEIAKCHLQIGTDNLKQASNHAISCFKYANEVNSHTYMVNSTVLMGAIEFQTGFKRKCSQGFTFALRYARIVNVPGVIQFLEEVTDMTLELERYVDTPKQRMQMDLLDVMPELTMRSQMRRLLGLTNKKLKRNPPSKKKPEIIFDLNMDL